MKLIQIGAKETAFPVEEGSLFSELVRATRENYVRTGFEPPWCGYAAELDGRIVGVCAFKEPVKNGVVEIAYCTFPENEGRGIASAMAKALLEIAARTDPKVRVTAQTLPEKNASTRILEKLGFERAGTAIDHEAGEVWSWELKKHG